MPANGDARTRIALVTGASAGLGAHFARQVDADGEVEEIWLVARRRAPMDALAAELTRTRGVPIEADLSSAAGVRAVAERLAAEQPDLRILVNNAGFAQSGRFASLDRARQLEMIDLNVRALTELTHLGLEWMGPGGVIVQVSSVLGMLPASGWSVYAGTKAYVINFGVALAGELAERGIKCTVCCPGPMRTEFYEVAGEGRAMPLYVDPGRVAELALRHGRRGKLISIKGLLMKLGALMSRLLPRRLIVWGARRWSR